MNKNLELLNLLVTTKAGYVVIAVCIAPALYDMLKLIIGTKSERMLKGSMSWLQDEIFDRVDSIVRILSKGN